MTISDELSPKTFLQMLVNTSTNEDLFDEIIYSEIRELPNNKHINGYEFDEWFIDSVRIKFEKALGYCTGLRNKLVIKSTTISDNDYDTLMIVILYIGTEYEKDKYDIKTLKMFINHKCH